jgi:hypothetical protein
MGDVDTVPVTYRNANIRRSVVAGRWPSFFTRRCNVSRVTPVK